MQSLILSLALSGAAIASGLSSTHCKAFPGDKAWPSQADWSSLNKTVAGRLVATIPLGAPCHGSSFNNATCESLKEQWKSEQVQYVQVIFCEAVS